MGTKKKSKRSRVKPFLKIVNANHIMPTRYSLSVEFNKKIVTKDCVKDPVSQRHIHVHYLYIIKNAYMPPSLPNLINSLLILNFPTINHWWFLSRRQRNLWLVKKSNESSRQSNFVFLWCWWLYFYIPHF